MAVKISHVIVPVNSFESMLRARDFFVNVIGLHVRYGMPPDGVATNADIWKEEETRFPDRILHLMDDYGTFVDIVFYDKRPVSYAKGIGSGKGLALAFQVPDEKQVWDKIKEYPAQVAFAPGDYPTLMQELEEPWLGVSHSFFAIDIGRVSEDGEEQMIELCEMKKA
jgi:hypothetical protein